MVDHHILFRYFRTTMPYKVGFYVSLIGMGLALHLKKRGLHDTDEERTEVKPKPDRTPDASLTSKAESNTVKLDYAVMLFEYAMFVIFVAGMTSGLPIFKKSRI
eukprot:TRINITY_DN33609_c0_g2_i1.p2 TRINITY_DN33609_c0_g2~~TRINITY_DN33609_c0_g2_i1.p2  ORF type:complete len:104 (-),score=21.97 TRINITY_DN33609_c0_g2_i1:591-902(-)